MRFGMASVYSSGAGALRAGVLTREPSRRRIRSAVDGDDPDLEALVDLGCAVRDRVVRVLHGKARGDPARPVRRGAADLQYALDELAEAELPELAARFLTRAGLQVHLLAEGLPPEGLKLGSPPRHLLLVDPVDGTRGLMLDKRSAFFLAALAPLHPPPRMQAVTCAVMVEIPTTRSRLSDVLGARRGGGCRGFTEDLDGGGRTPLVPAPSRATSLDHGFASFMRFGGGTKGALGELEDAFLLRATGGDPERLAAIFEDQLLSNGGQLHALLTGRDRMVADLRPLLRQRQGSRMPCAHPYDLAGALVAREGGVVLTALDGGPLDPPLDLVSEVGFVAYASPALQQALEPHLQAALAAWLGPDDS